MQKWFKQCLALVMLLSVSLAWAEEDSSFLLVASGKGELELVKAMLDSGADPNMTDRKGLTPLMYAARKDEQEVIKLLLARGADIDAKDKSGWSALMVAIKKDHPEMARLLLENGANPHIIDPTGWNALNLAAVEGYHEVARALLEYGVDVNARNVDKKTALMMAAKSGNPETVAVLIEYHANLTVQDHLGTTALMYAAREGNVEVINRFADYFAKLPEKKHMALLDQEDGSEWTALTWAVKKEQWEAAKALIEAGADYNHKDSEGTPLLHIAVNNDDDKTVDLLLSHQVNVKAKDQYGLTALVYALKEKHTEIAKKIKAAGGHY